MNVSAPPAAPARRGSRTLILLAVLFIGPILLALALGLMGVHPSATRNKGEWLQPYADLRALAPPLADGGEYRWDPPQRLWRIAVVAPAACAADCTRLVGELDKVWRLLGAEADRVQILWIGELPAGAPRPSSLRLLRADTALLEKLPRAIDAAGAPLYVIDPNGFAILRYAPGFDPADLRADLGKLLKLM